MKIELSGARAEPAWAWAVLGDTDHLNRQAGMGAVRMRLEPGPAGVRVVGDMDGPLGARMPFVEQRNDWVHGRWFRQERVYRRAPIAASRFLLVLAPDGDGVRPQLTLELEPAAGLLAPAVHARGRAVARHWQAVLDALPAPGAARSALPAFGPVRRRLDGQAAAAFDRWSAAVAGPVVPAVRRWVAEARDTELQRIRPFAVADRCGLDRHETLVAMLHAVGAGALELYFVVRCVRCSGEVASARSLSDLVDHAECPACRIGFAPDLAASVEVVFAPHPAVLPHVAQRFCTMFPAAAPEIRVALALGPGERREEPVVVPPGGWRLGAGGGAPDLELVAGSAGQDAVVWTPAAAGEVAVRSGPLSLALHNGDAPARLILASHTAADPVVPASVVASLPEFRRAFGPAALAPHVRLSARRVALVFTDLSGSTSMYEALGDAAAYAVVRDHFLILQGAVEAHRGVVVKTIGDAVMASFATAVDAFDAAVAMRSAFDAWAGRLGLTPTPRLNLGVHVGPALAVQAGEGGLDWFGRHVNLAARVQGAASGGALLITPEVAADPEVAARLAGQAPEAVTAVLKGIGEVGLLRIP